MPYRAACLRWPGSLSTRPFSIVQRLPVAGQRLRRLTQVGLYGQAQHVADAFVGHGALALQAVVAGGFAGQAVQILLRALDQQFTGVGRAGQRHDGVVQFEEHGVGQAAHVLEALLGADALAIGHVPLPGSGEDSAHQRDQKQGGGEDPGTMAVNEFAGAVAQGIGTRGDRVSVQVAAQVVGKLLDAAVAAHRFLAQRHQQDVVDIARQLAFQAVRRGYCARC